MGEKLIYKLNIALEFKWFRREEIGNFMFNRL